MSTIEPLDIPFQGAPFVAVVWSNLSDTPTEQMGLLMDDLLGGNCKYILCGGLQCSEWEEAADERHIARYPDYDPPESEHVMTTSHDGESIEEVMSFALNCTNFDYHEFRVFVVVALGASWGFEQQVLASAQREWHV